MKINDGKYTSGKSFRAIAEFNARKYRILNLKLSKYDRYGHILTDEDAELGLNYLPSLRKEIKSAIEFRNAKGKGIDIQRTSKNMLSSQAMCFNLFVPLNLDKKLLSKLFDKLIGIVKDFHHDIEIEYTPSNSIFNDQSAKGGVDCDALLQYINFKDEESLIVIETKYVEQEFSICGYRKSKQKDRCPVYTTINKDFSNCRYQYKKQYDYWKVAEESGLYKMDEIEQLHCPFGGTLWQLWTNYSLAYALARENNKSDFRFVVICPNKNIRLSENGKIFSKFKSFLKQPDYFRVVYLENIISTLLDENIVRDVPKWTVEFAEKYSTETHNKFS
jgi:hypothetical protein